MGKKRGGRKKGPRLFLKLRPKIDNGATVMPFAGGSEDDLQSLLPPGTGGHGSPAQDTISTDIKFDDVSSEGRFNPKTVSTARTERCGGKEVSGNAKSLILMSALFFAITLAQYVASLPQFANSLALRADCLSMFVDGFSYLGNLAAECNSHPQSKRCLEISMSGLSLSILLGFTVYFAIEAINDVLLGEAPGNGNLDSGKVDARYVLAFALVGLLVDLLSLMSFWCWAATSNTIHGVEINDGGVGRLEESPKGDAASHYTPGKRNINMISALVHVGSDLLRSLTTLVEAIVILANNQDAKGKDTLSSSDGAFDSVQADGLAALVVCAIIAAGAILALVTWVQELNADLQATVMLTQRSPLEKPCSTEVEAINSSRRANKGIERSRDESLDKKNKKTEYAFIRGGTPRTTSPTFSVESEESDGFGDSRHNHFAVGPSDLTFTTTLV